MDTTSTALRIWEADPQAPTWAGMQAGLAWRRTQLAAQEQAVNMKQQAVGLIGQELQNKQRSMMIDREQTDENRWAQEQPGVAAWMQKPATEILSSPMPSVQSKQGLATVHTVYANAAASANAQARMLAASRDKLAEADWFNRNGSLPPGERIPLAHPGGPNAMDWNMLRAAETAWNKPMSWQNYEIGKQAGEIAKENNLVPTKVTPTKTGPQVTYGNPPNAQSGWGAGVHQMGGELYMKETNDPMEIPKKVVAKGQEITASIKARLIAARPKTIENLQNAESTGNKALAESLKADLEWIDSALGYKKPTEESKAEKSSSTGLIGGAVKRLFEYGKSIGSGKPSGVQPSSTMPSSGVENPNDPLGLFKSQ